MESRANIVLITADSLRADRLGCYSSAFCPSLTPNLDQLAKRSTVFTHAYAQGPYTTLSLPALFTGKYPAHLRPMGNGIHWDQPPGVVVRDSTTFVELLKSAGYHTAALHSNPLVSRLFHFDRGFDFFFDDVLLSHSPLPARLKLTAARLQRIVRVDPYMSAGELNGKVLEWLKTAVQPFFLWVHYMDTHGPYLARKTLKYLSRGERLWHKAVTAPEKVSPRQREALLQNYHRQIATVDKEVGRLLQALGQMQRLDSTLLIFSSDHGDEFLEHGGFSHKPKLYDELLHVPLIVHVPGAAPGTISALTELIQLAPTIAAFAGALPADCVFDSRSLLPGLRHLSVPPKDFIFAQAGIPPRQAVCLRTRDWKLILKNQGKDKELYCLPDDPLERVNLAAERCDIVRELESKLESDSSGTVVPRVA